MGPFFVKITKIYGFIFLSKIPKHGLESRGPGGTPPSKPKSSTPPPRDLKQLFGSFWRLGKSILQVPDTGTRVLDNTRQFLCSSIVSFWITLACSKERKYHIFGQYWYTKNVPVLTNTGTFQYLGPEVYFFRRLFIFHSVSVLFSLKDWYLYQFVCIPPQCGALCNVLTLHKINNWKVEKRNMFYVLFHCWY